MNKEQAKRLIKDTFEAPFDKGKFVIFIKKHWNVLENIPMVRMKLTY